jgi:hypothetical protein
MTQIAKGVDCVNVHIIFSDLTMTLDVRHFDIDGVLTLKEAISEFASEWEQRQITIFGRQVQDEDLCETVHRLSHDMTATGRGLVLEIEKHR